MERITVELITPMARGVVEDIRVAHFKDPAVAAFFRTNNGLDLPLTDAQLDVLAANLALAFVRSLALDRVTHWEHLTFTGGREYRNTRQFALTRRLLGRAYNYRLWHRPTEEELRQRETVAALG